MILAVGGGSVIDTAKCIALGVPYDGDVWDLYTHAAEPVAGGKPTVVCILTIPAAGSEASASSVLTNDETLLKKGLSTELNRPVVSIMDPELTFTLPAYQTAARHHRHVRPHPRALLLDERPRAGDRRARLRAHPRHRRRGAARPR